MVAVTTQSDHTTPTLLIDSQLKMLPRIQARFYDSWTKAFELEEELRSLEAKLEKAIKAEEERLKVALIIPWGGIP